MTPARGIGPFVLKEVCGSEKPSLVGKKEEFRRAQMPRVTLVRLNHGVDALAARRDEQDAHVKP